MGMLNELQMHDKYEGTHQRGEENTPVTTAWLAQSIAERKTSYYEWRAGT